MPRVNFVSGNTLTLLCCGVEFFPALIQAIDQAKNDIYLETYIFADDETGRQVKNALLRARERGCAVHVITDWHGTGHYQGKLLKAELQAKQVGHRFFNPWFRRGMTRLHRKLCVVDGMHGFIGGININDDLYDDANSDMLPFPRWDFAVQVQGPLVSEMYEEMQVQWARLGKIPIVERLSLFRQLRVQPRIGENFPALAGLVVQDNFRNRHVMESVHLHALNRATRNVILVTPYFAPGHKLRVALMNAAARGVEVILLIGVGQFDWQDAVAHALYPKLLKHNVHVVEYRRTQLHAKCAVVDDDWATIGSSNCDGFSLFLNQEANIVVRDRTFVQKLRTQIQMAIEQGVHIQKEDCENTPWYRQLRYIMSFIMYRAVMKLMTWGSFT
jgi:cardiolipin synthase